MARAHELELRDWFAGQALAGILTSPGTPRPGESPMDQHADAVAEQAYAYADAMLKLRRNGADTPAGDVPDAFGPAEEVAERAAGPRSRRAPKRRGTSR
jgi:hypothetical protein